MSAKCQERTSTLFDDIIGNGEGALRFREKIAVCDTFNIPNLLAIPL